MCKLEYNQHVKSRIDSLIDAMFELRPGTSLVVHCDPDHKIRILTQGTLPMRVRQRPRVSDKCDAELDAMGVM